MNKQVFLEDAELFKKQSKTYANVLEHRRKCKKWGKGFCLRCFGGGLTNFVINLCEEFRQEKEGEKNETL